MKDVNGHFESFGLCEELGQLPLSLCCAKTEIDPETEEQV